MAADFIPHEGLWLWLQCIFTNPSACDRLASSRWRIKTTSDALAELSMKHVFTKLDDQSPDHIETESIRKNENAVLKQRSTWKTRRQENMLHNRRTWKNKKRRRPPYPSVSTGFGRARGHSHGIRNEMSGAPTRK